MIRFLLLLLVLPLSAYAFEDKELDSLWSSIKDITQPTLEEWHRIEKYLQEGERPYLKPLENSSPNTPYSLFKIGGPK